MDDVDWAGAGSWSGLVYTLIFLCIMGGLWVLWVGLSWWALLREKRRPLTLTAIADEDPRTKHPYVMAVGHKAEQAGFRRIGTFVDGDPGWRQGAFSMLLRPDGLTLARIHHGLIKRIVLISAMTSDVWVVTVSSMGDPDGSGLSEEELVFTDKEFEKVLARHDERIAGREGEIVPWVPDEIAADLVERDRRKVEKLIEMGRARVREPLTGRWSFTFAGASAQRVLNKKFFKEMTEQAKKRGKK